MGAFFKNIAVKTEDLDRVKKILKKGNHTAYISSPKDGWVVVYDKKSELDVDHAHDLSEIFSKGLRTTVLLSDVNDSDFYNYSLYYNGKGYDAYINNADRVWLNIPSNAEYLTEEINTKEKFINFSKGRPKTLIALTSKSGVSEGQVEEILGKKYTFAEHRFDDLVRLFRIPALPLGYNYLENEGKELISKEFDSLIQIKGKE